ncbi:hypothetical protein ACO22_07786 [Paracoccidioides brasiliensis]|uniref:Uncharacterized protein n=1 Tax=Paracoccidioides brasiliensis TaxID=121759 RepID=A0A1D2J3N3_PARBR|nr:hypothetical protein ACO22_07786 [Paracoccidioides brasiliensis]
MNERCVSAGVRELVHKQGIRPPWRPSAGIRDVERVIATAYGLAPTPQATTPQKLPSNR